MDKINFDSFKIVARLLGDIAPDISSLSESCKKISDFCKKCYCCHCGKIFTPDDKRIFSNRRGEHNYRCELPDKLDPFTFVYKFMEWDKSFVAGGWATFIHFKEHLSYINPWRDGGEIQSRDLDIFYYNSNGILKILDIMNRNVEILAKYKNASKWDCKLNRYNTREDASFKYKIKDRNSKKTATIDIVGSLSHKSNRYDILDTFDIPCCKVGFCSPDKKIWVLSNTHRDKLPKEVKVREIPDYGDDDEGEEYKKIAEKNIQKSIQRDMERLLKYKSRGYDHNRCDCDKMKQISIDLDDKLEENIDNDYCLELER